MMLSANVEQEYSYPILQKVESWLSHGERNFIKVLNRVVAGRAFLFAKTRLNDVLLNADFYEEQEIFDFGDRVFDFVLCDKDDLSLLCVIELDDRRHQFQHDAENDYESLCGDANIPLIKIPARCGYSEAELNGLISAYI